MKKYAKRSKAFLCKHDNGGATVRTNIFIKSERKYNRKTEKHDGAAYKALNADITVTDCSRSVCLDFSLNQGYNDEEGITFARRIAKVQKLIDELTTFRDNLIQGWEVVE